MFMCARSEASLVDELEAGVGQSLGALHQDIGILERTGRGK